MNARRVHELMRQHFPGIPPEATWVNAADKDGLRKAVIRQLVSENIDADHLVVEINRRLGGLFPTEEAIELIAQNWAQGAKVTDRAFTGFVCVATNGVALGFKAQSADRPNPSFKAEPEHSATTPKVGGGRP